MRHGRTAFVACAAGVAAVASCQDPTELTLRVTTSAKCADFGGTAIAVGSDPNATETHFEQGFVRATTPASRCDSSGLIGTLVVTPGTETGSVLVAAAVRGHDGTLLSPLDCAMPTNATSEGCIIARRSFTFSTHHPLTLPIDLDPRCAGVSCTPGNTCYRGACVDEAVACNGTSCDLGVVVGAGQGAGSDAGTSDGSYEDVSSEDASLLLESGVVADSGTDAIVSTNPEAGTEGGTGRPTCQNVVMSGGMFMYGATCDEGLGYGDSEPFYSMPSMGNACTCNCIDGLGNSHGALQCTYGVTTCMGVCVGSIPNK